MAQRWNPWKPGAQKEFTIALGGPTLPINPTGPQLSQLDFHRPPPRQTCSRSRRGLISDEAIPFSRLQCVLSLFAYVWLLTNLLRTGFEIRQLGNYNTVEPNVFVNFGPYAYTGNIFFNNSVGASLSNVTAAKPVALWGYKYDTTSLAIRAFAEYLNVSAFPACVLYRGKCAGDFLTPATGFKMLDSLVDAVRDVGSIEPRASSLVTQDPKYHQLHPRTLLLRTSYEYFDRIHHYIMPQIFSNPFWRTCHALYYSPEVLSQVSTIYQSVSLANSSTSLVDFCSLAYGGLRPYFCDDLWANFGRACSPADPKGRAVGHVSVHAATRLSKLRALHPNATVDLLIVEGIVDIAIHRGGLTFLATRGADIVMLFRIRRCNNMGACETLVLDEYRYEGETFTTDVLWYRPLITSLRGAAQTYYWLRLLMLFGGCYYAAKPASQATNESSGPSLKTVKRAFMIFFKIPSQVVIYGSVFPLMCYFLAHVIDSPMVYELMGQKFSSFNGLFKLNFFELITISSIQMRNVWVLATIVHMLVRVATQRGWTPLRGVWGVPQFSIALISALTVFSQFRLISLRWMPIRSILAVHVTSRLHPVIESLAHLGGDGGKSTLGGVFLDLKAMTCSVAVLALLVGFVTLTIKVCFKKIIIKLVFWRSHSVTPLSAGVLWPTTCLAVGWNDDLFHIQDLGSAVIKRVPSSPTKIQPSKASLFLTSNLSILQHTVKPIKIESLDDRSQVVESTLYLMNITMLSDPFAFLLWKGNLSKTSIGYYRSTKNQKMYLVPRIYTQKKSELDWGDFELVRTVLAHELTWREIITCG